MESDNWIVQNLNSALATWNEKLAEILKVHENEIKAVVLAEQIFIGQKNGYVKEWDINGENTILGVAKVL